MNDLLKVNQISNINQPEEENDLRWVVNHCVEGLHQIFTLHLVEIQTDSCPFGLHVAQIIRLVGEQRDAHHGHSVVDGLIEPVCAAMGDEGFGLGMAFVV